MTAAEPNGSESGHDELAGADVPAAAITTAGTAAAVDDRGDDRGRIKLIERSLDIIESMADGPRTLTEIAQATGLAKATAFRLLAALGPRGVVLKDPATARYMLGPGLLRMVNGAMAGLGAFAAIGREELAELSEGAQETVALHVRVGFDRVCVYEIAGPQAIRYTSGVGSSASLATGSAGLVLLAAAEPRESDRLVTLLSQSDHRRGELDARVRQTRVDGWAISVGERVEGASAISVPVRGDALTISLSVLGPTSRLPRERLLGFLPALERCAGVLSLRIDRSNEAIVDADH